MERLISRKNIANVYIEFFKENNENGSLRLTRYVKSENSILAFDYLTIDKEEYRSMLSVCHDFESLYMSLEFYFQRVMACI